MRASLVNHFTVGFITSSASSLHLVDLTNFISPNTPNTTTIIIIIIIMSQYTIKLVRPPKNMIVLFYMLLYASCLYKLVNGRNVPNFEPIKCSASLNPQTVTTRQFSDTISANHQVIRCNATINIETFTNPVFDLTFGLTPLTGIFYLRGSKKCSHDNKFCWSDFKIPSQTLMQLFRSIKIESDDNNIFTTAVEHQMTHRSSIVDFTCNVADIAGNSSHPVRCSDSGKIFFAKGN